VSRPAAETLLMRDMVAADLTAMANLWVASWQAAMPHIDFEARRAWFVGRMADHDNAGARTIIAQCGSDIAGFVVIDPASGYLDQIAVSPARQGQGVATALLARAKEMSPRHIELDVNRTNARAIRFYEREGFRIVGEGANPNSGAPIYKMQWRSAQGGARYG